MALGQLNASLPALDVLRWLGLPHYKTTSGTWRGKCPYHQSGKAKSRSLAVNLATRKFFCHNCKQHGDLIDLVCKVRGCNLAAAAIQLEEEFGRQLGNGD